MSTIKMPDIHATFAVEHLEAGNKDYLLIVLHPTEGDEHYLETAIRASSKESMSDMLGALHDKCVEALTKNKDES